MEDKLSGITVEKKKFTGTCYFESIHLISSIDICQHLMDNSCLHFSPFMYDT